MTMKFKLLLILWACLLSANLYAEPKPTHYGRFMPDPSQFNSEAVYITSSTCSQMTALNVVISTRPALLYAINVSSQGLGDSMVQVFDSRVSTFHAQSRTVAQGINATTNRQHFYNI